jgi:hypothetical protein
MPAPEPSVNITQGAGTAIDTFNVGSGAVGSGSEALRQAVIPSDPQFQGNVQHFDASGNAYVGGPVLDEILMELRAIRLGIAMLLDHDLKEASAHES